MEDTNKVVVVGRLVRDAELSYTQSGVDILKFAVAINGRKDDEVHFIDVVKWKGEKIAQYLTKGKQVVISGRLTQDRWEAQDGSKRSKVYVTAEAVQMIGGRDGNSQGVQRGGPPSDRDDPASPQYQGAMKFEDDVPF